MFTIPTKTQYGISAIIELAKNSDCGPVKIKDLAKRGKIPKTYLDQIFNQLQKHGILKSTRGSKGGYELAESSDALTLIQVIEALEGKTDLNAYQGPKSVLELFETIISDVKLRLDISIAEIVERQQKMDQYFIYHI